MIQVGLLGKSGRMGSWVTKLLESDYADRARLKAAVGSGESIDALLDCDVVIDFSSSSAMASAAQVALADRKSQGKSPAWVIGSTGWTAEQRSEIEKLAKKTPVLMASNFSTGVLALAEILKQAAPLLTRLGYTPVLVETHHTHKKDAPSGTALMLQRVISPESPSKLQTHSVRVGEVIGDHELTFSSPGDQIRMGHFAGDRSIFARGAIETALWLGETRDQVPTGSILSIDAYFRAKFMQS